VYLPQFLAKESCQELTNNFKNNYVDKGFTITDDQCPLSHSLGHSPLFDKLLEDLTPHVEKNTGLKLLPTYAYARWYAPGDELKIHRDRPSCEISATITLGFEGNQWPIYMGYDENKFNFQKIDMQVGDAVIYKGEQLYHWREKYSEGKWQAQVFIHYVDANGKNAEWKFDKREKLAHHNQPSQSNDNHENFIFLVKKNAFSLKSCQGVINQFEKRQDLLHEAELVGNLVDKSVRDTKRINLHTDSGIGATLTGIGLAANKHSWNFDITHSNQSEYLRYDKDGHFSEHIDTLMEEKIHCRKLTVIAFLNDDFEGGRLYLRHGVDKTYPSQEPGDVVIFPSFLLHGVEPVISGIRRSIVTWLIGPYFK